MARRLSGMLATPKYPIIITYKSKSGLIKLMIRQLLISLRDPRRRRLRRRPGSLRTALCLGMRRGRAALARRLVPLLWFRQVARIPSQETRAGCRSSSSWSLSVTMIRLGDEIRLPIVYGPQRL